MKIKLLISIFVWLQVKSFVHGLEFYNATEDSSRRILYGEAGDPYFFPYFVRLLRKDDTVLCGGSIIHENWILTAAHCFWDEDCAEIKIKPALWDLDKFIKPIECILHTEFSLDRYPFDIGLARVGKDFDTDTKSQKIDLPPLSWYTTPGDPATIMGWGLTEKNSPSTAFLHALVQVISWEDCNKEWRATNKVCDEEGECPDINIPKRVVCVKGQDVDGSPGACFGDSGGPVVIRNILAGVYSFSARLPDPLRCIPKTPSIYTSTADYLAWIYSFVDPTIDRSVYPYKPEPDLP